MLLKKRRTNLKRLKAHLVARNIEPHQEKIRTLQTQFIVTVCSAVLIKTNVHLKIITKIQRDRNSYSYANVHLNDSTKRTYTKEEPIQGGAELAVNGNGIST